MHLTISIAVDDVAEAIEVLNKLGATPPPGVEAPVVTTSTVLSAPVPTPKKKKRGPYKTRAAAEVKAKPVEIPASKPEESPGKRPSLAAEPVVVTPAPLSPATVEDVQAVLKDVFENRGFDVTAALLSRFGVQRASELKDEQRAEFAERARAVLAGVYDPLS